MVGSGGSSMDGLVKHLVKRWIGSDGGNDGKLYYTAQYMRVSIVELYRMSLKPCTFLNLSWLGPAFFHLLCALLQIKHLKPLEKACITPENTETINSCFENPWYLFSAYETLG